jgi:hypothetical protein
MKKQPLTTEQLLANLSKFAAEHAEKLAQIADLQTQKERSEKAIESLKIKLGELDDAALDKALQSIAAHESKINICDIRIPAYEKQAERMVTDFAGDLPPLIRALQERAKEELETVTPVLEGILEGLFSPLQKGRERQTARETAQFLYLVNTIRWADLAWGSLASAEQFSSILGVYERVAREFAQLEKTGSILPDSHLLPMRRLQAVVASPAATPVVS